jgi:hypothetical protein
MLLAQSAILRFSPVVFDPIAVMLSSIFYHTLGTDKKKVLNQKITTVELSARI